MIGRTIGKYRIIEALGRGGMGTVYKAVDETLDREVAIKVLNADLLETDGVKRFRAEAVTLAKLKHVGIAHVYELTRDGDNLLMVMEFVQGETFEKLVARGGALPVEQGVGLVAQVLDALQYAHNAGIVHRDLEPANIMLMPPGAIKVMDFGIARVQGSEHFTSSGYMMGTPAYMAPEQVRGEEVDARTDVYAMGVVLYQLLTGRLPFKADSAIAMIQKQLNDQPTPSREFRVDIPDWLDAVLRKALAKNPAERFAHADDMRQGLFHGSTPEQFAPTMGPTATPAFGAPTQAVTAAALATPVEMAPPRSGAGGVTQTTVMLQKSHLAGAAAVIGVLVVAVAALAFFMIRSRPTSAVAPVEQVATAPAVPPPAAPPVVSTAAPEAAPSTAPAQAPVTAAKPIANGSTPSKPAATSAKPESGAAKPASSPAAVDAVASPAPLAAAPIEAAKAAPAAREEAAAVTFKDVKLVVPDGDKAKEHDVVLKVGEGRVWAVSAKEPSFSKSMAYSSIVSVTYSQSKHPRWKEGIGVAVVAGVFSAPLFFMKSTKHWVTLQSKEDYFVLHVDKDDVRSILPAIESRTGVKVQRLEGDK